MYISSPGNYNTVTQQLPLNNTKYERYYDRELGILCSLQNDDSEDSFYLNNDSNEIAGDETYNPDYGMSLPAEEDSESGTDSELFLDVDTPMNSKSKQDHNKIQSIMNGDDTVGSESSTNNSADFSSQTEIYSTTEEGGKEESTENNSDEVSTIS